MRFLTRNQNTFFVSTNIWKYTTISEERFKGQLQNRGYGSMGEFFHKYPNYRSIHPRARGETGAVKSLVGVCLILEVSADFLLYLSDESNLIVDKKACSGHVQNQLNML